MAVDGTMLGLPERSLPGMHAAFREKYGDRRYLFVREVAQARHAKWLEEGRRLRLAVNWRGTVFVDAEEQKISSPSGLRG